VFPESIVLDNVIFSGDPLEIERHVVGMQITEEKRHFLGAVVFWQVSEKHGGRRIQEKMQSSIITTLGRTTLTCFELSEVPFGV
jgi:hypothetical protein